MKNDQISFSMFHFHFTANFNSNSFSLIISLIDWELLLLET